MEKVWTKVRKHRDTKPAATEKWRNYLVSEPIYHTTKVFMENLLEIDMKKTQALMNNPVYLGLSILDLSKTAMYEFWYDYIKPKYGEKVKLCYVDTDSFIFYLKNKWYLQRDCRICWNEIWHFKLWNRSTVPYRKK